MKIAIVHDFLREWGGAEEVLAALHEIWPEAPIYTSYISNKAFHFQPEVSDNSASYQKNLKHGESLVLNQIEVHTTWLNKLPEFLKTSKLITPLLPFAFSSFSFKDYDVVISNTASFAKSIDVQKPTIHICYCNTPPRFLYSLQRERSKSILLDLIERPIDALLRWLDQQAGKRVDYFIGNSGVVASRVKKIFGKDATVIYPPVDAGKFRSVSVEVSVSKKYFMTIGRLSPIKHFELAVEACTKLHLPLKVVGSGSDESRLRSIAGPSVEFLGRKSDVEVTALLQNCKAVINTIFDEDFGMVPLEVVAAGVPVIAFASDAAKETLSPGVTGEFFLEPTAESLVKVLQNFDEKKYNQEAMREHAKQFSKEQFKQNITQFIAGVVQ